jgi:hypothetical protein
MKWLFDLLRDPSIAGSSNIGYGNIGYGDILRN